MHIMEGYLPPLHAAAWTAVAAPFVVHGCRKVVRTLREEPEARLLLGASGAFCFLLSSLKIPSVAGSSSHPTGVGLGALLVGPPVMAVLGGIVLLFQALFLAHGGLTTLGANLLSMGVAGPWVAWWSLHAVRGMGGSRRAGVFAAATLGSLATYVVASVQLALAYPDPLHGVVGSALTFGGIFALTQVPISLVEGMLTVVAVEALVAGGAVARFAARLGAGPASPPAGAPGGLPGSGSGAS